MNKRYTHFLIFILLSFTLNSVWAEELTTEEPLAFKIKTTVQDLPPEMYDIDSRLEEFLPDREYEILILLNNDIGLGDDYGHTHGMKLISATRLNDGIKLTMAYTTDLYTQQAGEINEEGLTPQYFTDENFLRFILDNKEQNKLLYWKAEIGWQELNNNQTNNLMYASAQQRWLHKYLNGKQPLNIEDGRGREGGMMADASMGIEKNFSKGKFSVKLAAEIGSRQTKIPDSDSHRLKLVLGSSYHIDDNFDFNTEIGTSAKRHASGTEYSTFLGANFQSKHWKFGFDTAIYKGELDNHVLYNVPSIRNGRIDPVITLYGTYRFGNTGKRDSRRMIDSGDFSRR